MLRVFLKLVLIFVLVFAGVKIWYGRLEEKLLISPVAEKPAQAQKPVPKKEPLLKPKDYTIIVDRNIFQALITETGPQGEEVKAEELEPTTLKLSLMGTISGNEQDARAIISDDLKKQQDIYQVGDSIQGAVIKAIERGRVILQVNGADEVLNLKDREGGGPAYEPSPSDYYHEPEEQPEVQENPQPSEPSEQINQVRRGPLVRPRPRRFPLVQPNTPQDSVQPGGNAAERAE